ncbi:MAG TPA: GNAT family N-acetyltransferase [Bryobacteraceae bacterium]|nr:GNAT family N-acetyltransferase [Bryobacteraceae bacterium]
MALIRSATQEDASAIAQVHVESWRTTYRGIVPDEYLASMDIEERTGRWREILKSDGYHFVAEHDGEVVGFLSGGAIREPIGRYDAELYAIYLLAQCQRRGIGTALLIELARRLDQDGFQSLAVWVLEANAAADFYKGSGAVRVAHKEREIAGATVGVAAFGWPNLKALLASK